MSELHKCPKCGEDLRLFEDTNRTSVGGVPDTSVVMLWKCPKCEYVEAAD
jgi:ribosomal protein S27AE